MKCLNVEYLSKTNVLFPIDINEILDFFTKGETQIFEDNEKKVTLYPDGTLEILGFETAPELFNDRKGHNKEFCFGQYEAKKLKNAIKKIVVLEGVKALNEYFAIGFDNLKEVILPNSLEDIGQSAFEMCVNLTKINFPKNLKKIGKRAFYSLGFDGELYLPNSITEIGERAFACSKIKSIVLPNSISKIAEDCFTYCFNLQEIQIPNGVKVIEKSAFCRCSKLKSVTFPATLEKIGKYAFEGCKMLENALFFSNVEICDNAFLNSGYEKILAEKEIGNTPKTEWNKDFGEIKNEVELVERLRGRDISEQAKQLMAKFITKEDKYSYGELDSSSVFEESEILSRVCNVSSFIVKNGVIVGIVYDKKNVLFGVETILYSATDDDGTGSTSVLKTIKICFSNEV